MCSNAAVVHNSLDNIGNYLKDSTEMLLMLKIPSISKKMKSVA